MSEPLGGFTTVMKPCRICGETAAVLATPSNDPQVGMCMPCSEAQNSERVAPPIEYKLSDGISLAGKVWWPVMRFYGRCGCGKCDMHGTVAMFESQELARNYIDLKINEVPKVTR